MRENVRNDVKNHYLRLSIREYEFALDNPRAVTYHTRACAKGLIPDVQDIQSGNRGNRGADSHDE